MGNCMFACGSKLLDIMGFGVRRLSKEGETEKLVANDEIDCDENERVIKNIEEMELYCKPLIFIVFKGQTSNAEDTDNNASAEAFNLGMYLQELDMILRLDPLPEKFNSQDPIFLSILRKIADKRHRDEEAEEKCYKRLVRDAKRFEKIYKERAAKHPENSKSEELEHKDYWGTRQQLLAGKVICDWLCEDDRPPMDPIFGVLLNPTAGRVGPGDSSWVHSLLYDNSGEWAHHSAVHDAFGYLFNFHETGPGYNYMYRSFLDKDNPLSGQISGIDFWKKYVQEIETKLKVIENFKSI